MNMQRAPSLNLKPEFTETMGAIVAKHLRSEAPYHLPTTKQYPLRCPGCTNQACADSKEFFATFSPIACPVLPATATPLKQKKKKKAAPEKVAAGI